MNKGDRIGAFIKAEADEVFLLGYGRVGRKELPPEAMSEKSRLFRAQGVKSTKFLLDSGETVWDFECFYAPEDVVKRIIIENKMRVTHVKLNFKREVEVKT